MSVLAMQSFLVFVVVVVVVVVAVISAVERDSDLRKGAIRSQTCTTHLIEGEL